MQREFGDSLLKICTNPKLQEALDSILIKAEQDLSAVETIQVYYSWIRTELEELASDYLNTPTNVHTNEIIANESFFKEQLSYLWIRLQSDWIRYNNLANFKLLIEDKEDFTLQSKAAICSFFIQPIGLLLDKEIVNENLEFVYNLLNRSELSTDSII